MSNIDNHNNGEKIYNYTYQTLIETSKQIDKFSQRIIAIIGFNAVFLTFGIRLNSVYRLIILGKIISISCIIFSLLFCLNGILPKNSGKVSTSKDLVDNLWYENEEIYHVTLIDQWGKAIETMNETIAIKQKAVLKAVIATILGVIFFGLTIEDNLIVKFLDTF